MPMLSARAIRTIRNDHKKLHARNHVGQRRRRSEIVGGSRWYQLAANLDAGGTADAHPLVWDAAAEAYTVDDSETVTLADLVGQHWGLEGERLQVEVRPAQSGAIYEAISSGAAWHAATLDAELSAGGSAEATVTIGGESVTVTVVDLWLEEGDSLPAGQVVGITYDVNGGRWVDTETACG